MKKQTKDNLLKWVNLYGIPLVGAFNTWHAYYHWGEGGIVLTSIHSVLTLAIWILWIMNLKLYWEIRCAEKRIKELDEQR